MTNLSDSHVASPHAKIDENFSTKKYKFGCPIITHEPLDRFTSNLEWRTRENHGNFISLTLRFKIEWVDFKREK